MNFYIRPDHNKKAATLVPWREEMNDRVMEIVVYIVDSMNSKNDDDNLINQILDLSTKLENQGYTENEIDLAFSWLMENVNDSNENGKQAKDLSPSILSPTPWINIIKSSSKQSPLDLIYQLKELETLGEEEIENILDHSLMQGKQGTSLSEIEAITSGLIFNPNESASSSFFVLNQKYHRH